jgi:hypothetical protein
MTPSHQAFIKAREMCLEMGGDIVQENFGPAGSDCSSKIQQAIGDSGQTKVWIGAWDEGKEDTWRFISSGAEYDVFDDDITAAYHWRPNYGASSEVEDDISGDPSGFSDGPGGFPGGFDDPSGMKRGMMIQPSEMIQQEQQMLMMMQQRQQGRMDNGRILGGLPGANPGMLLKQMNTMQKQLDIIQDLLTDDGLRDRKKKAKKHWSLLQESHKIASKKMKEEET